MNTSNHKNAKQTERNNEHTNKQNKHTNKHNKQTKTNQLESNHDPKAKILTRKQP